MACHNIGLLDRRCNRRRTRGLPRECVRCEARPRQACGCRGQVARWPSPRLGPAPGRASHSALWQARASAVWWMAVASHLALWQARASAVVRQRTAAQAVAGSAALWRARASAVVSGWRCRLRLGLLRLRRFLLHAVVEDSRVAVPCRVGAVSIMTAIDPCGLVWRFLAFAGPVVGPPRAIPGCPLKGGAGGSSSLAEEATGMVAVQEALPLPSEAPCLGQCRAEPARHRSGRPTVGHCQAMARYQAHR